MLDIKFIKENLKAVKENIKKRQVDANAELAVMLYDKRNKLQQQLDELRRKRNQNAQEMKARLPDKERAKLIQVGKDLKQEITFLEKEYNTIMEELRIELEKIPNMTHPDSPEGSVEADNRELKRWGKIPEFDFKPKDHIELGKLLDLIDFKTAQGVSGQKFYFLKNEAVILELALIRYAIDILKEEGFTLTITPDIAREDIVAGIGFNPRGAESNIYRIADTDTCLIATAEITLGGYYANSIIDASSLPIKLAGFSHCFRREAGAAGQYSKGLYRVHQFSKVEMFIFCHPEQSDKLHKYILDIEEHIYRDLEIPYRVVDVCRGDLGNPAYRKFDIEAWMPGRGDNGEWGEITSTSNCTDYQARRLKIRFKQEGANIFVHMLNGTAVALSRALIAIFENFQRRDGSIAVPAKLVPYTGFKDIIPS